MKFAILLVVVAYSMAYPNGTPINPSDELDDLAKGLNQEGTEHAGSIDPVSKLVNLLLGKAGPGTDEHGLIIGGDDGQVHHPGVIGEVLGTVLGLVAYLLGGPAGMCGSEAGINMKEGGGLLGLLFNLLGPLLGPLASDNGDNPPGWVPDTNTNPGGMTPPGDRINKMMEKVQQLIWMTGGTQAPVGKLLNFVLQLVSKPNGQHSMFIPGKDGKIHHGGLLGDLLGNVLGTLGMILGGKNGMCGGLYGASLKQGQGLVGFLTNVLGL